jgi:hypothetical protein
MRFGLPAWRINSSKRARGVNVCGEIIAMKFYFCPKIFKNV